MSCKIDYIEDRFRESNPTLADSLTGTFDAIKVKVLESKLFKPANDGTGRYLFAQESKNITAYNAQKAFVDDVNDSYKGEVIENYNGAVRINVLNLPEAQQALGTYVTPIKEGVPELFDSNPELANAVYEAAGFKSFDTKGVSLDTKERDGWKWIKLNGKNIGEVKLVKNDRRSKEVGLSIKLNEEYQNKGYGQIVHTLVADWAKNEFGDTLYSDFDNSQAEINTLLALTKKGYAEQIGDYGTQKDGRYSTDVRAFRIKTSDEIRTITPQQKQQAQQLYSQYLDSLNKPNTNPILQGNQQEQVKKFAELQERLNNKEFLEGAKSAYESTPALQQLGTQEEYNDYIARVSLGIIKNPSSGEYNYTSKVKDIVYHGRQTKENIKDKSRNKHGFYFGTKDQAERIAEMAEGSSIIYIQQAVLNLKNPKTTTFQDREVSKYNKTNDGFIIEVSDQDALDLMGSYPEQYSLENFKKEYVVFEPEQIHILGSKQDIEGFKQYIENVSSTTVMIAGKDAFEIDAMLDEDTRAKLAYLRGTNTLTIEC